MNKIRGFVKEEDESKNDWKLVRMMLDQKEGKRNRYIAVATRQRNGSSRKCHSEIMSINLFVVNY